jgi:hypothetical protein
MIRKVHACERKEHSWTPSPSPPPRVKARVAVHPLPQGGEGADSRLCAVRMYKLQVAVVYDAATARKGKTH